MVLLEEPCMDVHARSRSRSRRIFSCIGLYRLSTELGKGICSSKEVGLGWRDTTSGIVCGPGMSMDLSRGVKDNEI